ncbi:MAG: hypothetical protein ACREC6_10945, partial [Hyphomicrobiaceae bacterium]
FASRNEANPPYEADRSPTCFLKCILPIHAVNKDGTKIEIVETIDRKTGRPIALQREEFSRAGNGAVVRRVWTTFDADRTPVGEGTREVLYRNPDAGQALKPPATRPQIKPKVSSREDELIEIRNTDIDRYYRERSANGQTPADELMTIRQKKANPRGVR